MKKTSAFFIFGAMVLVLILSACAPQGESYPTSNLNQLSKIGLLDEHPIKTVDEVTTQSATISGSYFIFAGAIEGQSSTTVNLKFRWSPEENVWLFSIVDQTKFITIIDETKTEPVIVFDFSDTWLDQCYTPADSIMCQEIDPSDMKIYNRFVQSDHLDNVFVYMNSEDRANEPLLP